jgi:uncharacterized protein involved in outer membrane biogenesis
MRLTVSPRMLATLRKTTLAVLALVVVGMAGIAGLIATRDYAAMERQVINRIELETGSVLQFSGRRQVLWPKPKIVFDDIVFARPDQGFSIKAAQGVLNFELRDLVDGVIDGPLVTLTSAEIRVENEPLAQHMRSPRAITDLIDRISGAFDRPGRFKRLGLFFVDARVVFARGADGVPLTLDPLDLQLRYSSRKGRVDLWAKRVTGNQPLDIFASVPTREALGRGTPQGASFTLAAFGGRFSFDGTARRDPDLAVTGKVNATFGDAVERLLLQTASSRPLALDTTTATATMTLDPRGIGLDSLAINRIDKQLAGIAALREINGRWGVSATLAGDLVDGSGSNAMIAALRNPDGSWSSAPIALNPLPGLDLDIRLSTKSFKLGTLRLDNAALSILTRQGRAEFAIVDSQFRGGLIKGRVSLTETRELKLMLAADKAEFGALLDQAAGFSRLAGTGNFVMQLEGRGESAAAIARSLSGSGALDLKNGTLNGIDLQKLMVRASDARPESAMIVALGGRTPFEGMRVNLAIRDGIIEPVGSSFTSQHVTAMLEGQIDIPAQAHRLALVLRRRVEEAGKPTDFYGFRMEGPLFSPSIKADLKLVGRS